MQISSAHARMWPRKILYWRHTEDGGQKRRPPLDLLQKGGVYVLYRDETPFYIGKAKKLWTRLWLHAKPDARYGLFWNYFTVFRVDDEDLRGELEGILITAFPTANSAKPRIEKTPLPPAFKKKLFELMSEGMVGPEDFPTDTDDEAEEE